MGLIFERSYCSALQAPTTAFVSLQIASLYWSVTFFRVCLHLFSFPLSPLPPPFIWHEFCHLLELFSLPQSSVTWEYWWIPSFTASFHWWLPPSTLPCCCPFLFHVLLLTASLTHFPLCLQPHYYVSVWKCIDSAACQFQALLTLLSLRTAVVRLNSAFYNDATDDMCRTEVWRVSSCLPCV